MAGRLSCESCQVVFARPLHHLRDLSLQIPCTCKWLRGGDLGVFGKGRMQKAFEDTTNAKYSERQQSQAS